METILSNVFKIAHKVDLCRNCIHTFNCSLKSSFASTVLQCEEHQEERENNMKRAEISLKESVNYFAGLCQTCEHNKTCSLKEGQNLIIVCEHYE
jgi:hypothetical protein